MLVIKYIFFALIATFVNLLTQAFFLYIWILDLSTYLAIFFGTLTGLVAKYILDKKYIFYYEVKSKKEDSKKFLLYSVMGIFTTAIFWGFELGFKYLFKSNESMLLGGAIGLAIGYYIKYNLDKHYVFKEKI